MATLFLGAVLAARPGGVADPSIAAERTDVLRERAAEATERVNAVIERLQAALDAGRRGSALVIEGDQSPRPDLERAAAAIIDAADETARAQAATARVDGTLAAVAPQDGPLPAGPTTALLPPLSAGFAAAAEAADTFVARRHATERTLGELRSALAALEDDDPRSALTHLNQAERALDTVRDWKEPPAVLPVWVDTTADLLAAARRIAVASLAGDADAVKRAAGRYRRAAEEAHRADTALAIAIAESGSSLAATPLQLLADALEAATGQRQALAGLLDAR